MKKPYETDKLSEFKNKNKIRSEVFRKGGYNDDKNGENYYAVSAIILAAEKKSVKYSICSGAGHNIWIEIEDINNPEELSKIQTELINEANKISQEEEKSIIDKLLELTAMYNMRIAYLLNQAYEEDSYYEQGYCDEERIEVSKPFNMKISDTEISFNNIPEDLAQKLYSFNGKSLKKFLKKAAKIDVYPHLVGSDGNHKTKYLILKYEKNGYSETNILDIPVAPIGEAVYNNSDYALIRYENEEKPDYNYDYAETGETVAERLEDGNFAHYIVNNNNGWSSYYPTKEAIAIARKTSKTSKT